MSENGKHTTKLLDFTEIPSGTKLIKFICIDEAAGEDFGVELHGFYDEDRDKFYITDEILTERAK